MASTVRVYRIACRRKAAGRVRAYSGHLWAIADRTGRVLCYSLEYPTLELIQDCEHATKHDTKAA